MRLAVYTDAVELGGAERSLATLVGALRPDIDVVVVGVDGDVCRAVAAARPGAGVRVVPPIRGRGDLRAMAQLARALRALSPDLLQATLRTPWLGLHAVAVATLVRGLPVITVEQLPRPAPSRRLRGLKRLLSSRLTAQIAVGAAAADELSRATGVPRSAYQVVPNGVADVALEPLPRLAPGPVVGTLARLHRQKGLDLLLHAVRELPGVTAVVVGEGPERGRLESLAAELGVAGRVIFAGWSPTPRRYLPGFDVFVLPSRYEAFPLSIVEAMLAQRPVVATDVGSVAEAVEPRRTGLLVPPEDPVALAAALRELLADPVLAARLGHAARARGLERFSADAMARAYEGVYDRAARRESPRRAGTIA